MSADPKTLSAIWLWKHQKELVKDCLLGTLTRDACSKRLNSIVNPSRNDGLYVFNPEPMACARCVHAKGILWNEKEQNSRSKSGGEETDNDSDEPTRVAKKALGTTKPKINTLLAGWREKRRAIREERRALKGNLRPKRNIDNLDRRAVGATA